MKKYLLFYGQAYYPYGGANDLQGSFSSIEEAKLKVNKQYTLTKSEWKLSDIDWAHILNIDTGEITRCELSLVE